jgi:hypothetical protein
MYVMLVPVAASAARLGWLALNVREWGQKDLGLEGSVRLACDDRFDGLHRRYTLLYP